MALADYFQRAAVAAAQILRGFDEEMLRSRLDDAVIGLSVGPSGHTPEGRALTDMSVRLLARLYPTLVIAAAEPTRIAIAELATAINPNITIKDGPADVVLVIADGELRGRKQTVYAGSDGWDALISASSPRPVGDSGLPFGAGAAGAIAAANVFRAIFLADPCPDLDLRLPCVAWPEGQPVPAADGPMNIGSVALLGAGAIGQATAWALSRAPLIGDLDVVDHQTIDLSNLQRYLLADRADEGKEKASLLASHFTGGLRGHAHNCTWQEWVANNRPKLPRVLVALDTAQDRRAVQAALPGWIANAWTQPGDLGVSVHPSFSDGACLACIYLPSGKKLNEDELVAQALGLDHAVWGLAIRNLLHKSQPVPTDLLDAASQSLGIPAEAAQAFAGRNIRDLYVEGICGGTLVPLDQLGTPAPNMHVPVAHQSALAGVLLAAQLATANEQHSGTVITRIDLQRPIATHLTQPAAKDARGLCICQDITYQQVHQRKHGESSATRLV
jgi:hypothetical protein